MIELSSDDFAEVHRLISAGALIQGLIHNLNGPLQNLGMDMDMIGYSLEMGEGSAEELQQEIRTRIARMEEEFEQINRLIRITGSRAAPDSDQPFLPLGDFLDQELAFLQSSLYFKHHVEKTVELEEGLPELRTLHESVPEGLRSLLASVVEDMERREMTAFGLKVSAGGGGVLIEVTAGEGPLSETLLEELQRAGAEEEPRRVSADWMTAAHAALMLSRAGLSPEVEAGAEGTRIRLALGSSL